MEDIRESLEKMNAVASQNVYLVLVHGLTVLGTNV